MTAVSPYAPLRRNSFLRRSSSSIQVRGGRGRGTFLFAFFLFVVRFWREATSRQAIVEFFERHPRVQGLLAWFQKFLGAELIPDVYVRQIKDVAPIQRISVRSASDPSSLDEQRSQSSTSAQIGENQALIRQVLQYWFGQYSPDNSQKMLWMIASSSVELRTRVDKEITLRFEDLLLELSSSDSHRRWTDWC